MKKFLKSRFLAGALLACAANAMAEPVGFNVTSAILTPGAGYGVDGASNEGSGTLLDVLFTTGFSAQNFSLPLVGVSFTFLVGTLDFREINGIGGIREAETDGLDVAASLTFSSPIGSAQTLNASGVATAGPINGNDPLNGGLDYSLTWNSLTNISFGSGGLFDISFNPITFSATDDPNQNLNATVTLRALPSTTQAATVPEPGSLALIAAALMLAGMTTRRRRGTGD